MMKIRKTKLMLFHIKKVWMMLLCLLFIVAILPVSVFVQAEDQSRVVRVGWFDSPYNTMDDSGRRTGYSYEYQRKIAAYTGWTYEYIEGNWAELLEMLENGEIDILSDVSYTKERSEKMLFPSYAMGTEE